MCGILFVFSKKGRVLNKNRCLKSQNSLRNRGPNKTLSNFFCKNRIFICNTILSIEGNIKKGSQLYSLKNRDYISYNGEIYNYKSLANNEYYNNDTEFLLQFLTNLKSEKELKKLDGMFAFLHFNKKKNVITFGSDPQGEKRLYKFENEEFLLISSTPKAILKFLNFNQRLNKNAIKRYFHTRHFTLINDTIFKNIEILKPGNFYRYSLTLKNLKRKSFDDPIDWIDKNLYFKLKEAGYKKTKEKFKDLLFKTAHKMIPKINFSTIMSGGIDSTLISYILKNCKNHKNFIGINNLGKDEAYNNIFNLNKFFNLKKHLNIYCDEAVYNKFLIDTYKKINMPFTTHDNVGRNMLFQKIRKTKQKVLFGGDGADELLGGYKLYEKINWNKDLKKNKSPYSTVTMKNDPTKNYWNKILNKYRIFLPAKEANIQASLYLDYFYQCIGTHNISNDILSGENGIELRSIFINKDIIKMIINMPLNYKINLNNPFKGKIILKDIFKENFGKKNIISKVGFSGFPNETKKFLSLKNKKKWSNFVNKFLKELNKDKLLDSKKEKFNRQISSLLAREKEKHYEQIGSSSNKKNKSIQNQKILKKTSELIMKKNKYILSNETLNFRDLEWKLLNIFYYNTIFNKNIIK